MGAWNCSINGNDTAQDLISDYRAAFYYNDVDTALKKIFDYVLGYLDDDEMPDFIYSLADFMWKKGILTDEIKNKAIEMIDSNYGLEIWKEAGEKILNKRKKVLSEFKDKLVSPQPAKKKITLGMNITPIFTSGDVITFQLKTQGLDCSKYSYFDVSNINKYDGKYIVLRKLYDHISYVSLIEPNVKDTWAAFQILPYYFDSEPKTSNLDKFFQKNIEYKDIIVTESTLFYFKKRDYKLLGNIKTNLKEEYEHSYNDICNIFFSINKPWYHPEVEIIKKITELEKKN